MSAGGTIDSLGQLRIASRSSGLATSSTRWSGRLGRLPEHSDMHADRPVRLPNARRTRLIHCLLFTHRKEHCHGYSPIAAATGVTSHPPGTARRSAIVGAIASQQGTTATDLPAAARL